MEKIKQNALAVSMAALVLGLAVGYLAGNCADRRGSWEKSGGYGYGMHESMGGDMMMGGYYSGSEEDYDRAFLRGMIMHHEGAIIMSKKLLETTKRPELTKLGNDIIDAQTKEIEMMKGWEAEWFK